MLTCTRKHTGERPFQCHCSRRFSRLDNLRQHAQTVHVNEDIPGDSLAATSTRFQRQIRTDRVRPQGNNRPRSSTISSQGGHSRGHSRNLSASSVGSTASSMGMPEDLRRRPAPLAMANDPSKRAMMSIDTYNSVTGSPSQQYAYYPQSPTGFSTPTTATFSTGTASPGYASPPSSISRSSFYNGARHGRRLSVPSGVNPYQNTSYPPPYYSPVPAPANPVYSQQSSTFASPTSSVFSHGRRESESELDFRRRTWHSGTYPGYTQRPATSGLMYGQTPDEPRPAMSQQSAASQVTRLPGIESFDHAPPPTGRQPASSPMMVDSEPRPQSSGQPSDAGLHQNLTRLDITSANAPPPDGQWQAGPPGQPGYFVQQSTGMPPQAAQAPATSHYEQPSTPRRNKRQAWYGGPVGPVSFGRPSPEDSGSSDGVPTPLTQQGGEYHPVIVNQNEPYAAHAPAAVPVGGAEDPHKVYHASSYPLPPPQPVPQRQEKPEPIRTDSGFQAFAPAPGTVQAAQQHTYALQSGHDPRFSSGYMQAPKTETRNDMGRLEALVAVATSENRAVENRN